MSRAFAIVFLLVLAVATPLQAQVATSTVAAPIVVPLLDPFDQTHVEVQVREAFADVPILAAIAKCESDFTQFDESRNPLYGGTGGMVGVFQIAAALHSRAAEALGYNINTLEGNIAYARHLYENEGVIPWLASASCWNPQPIKGTLQLGSKSISVRYLQEVLNRNGYSIARTGEGSPGQETNVFGVMTRAAVQRFQCDRGIVCSGNEKTTGYGIVGKKTRLALIKMDATYMSKNETHLSKQQ